MASKKGSSINRQIVGFTKARKFLFFTIKPKPIYKDVEDRGGMGTASMETSSTGEVSVQVRERGGSAKGGSRSKKQTTVMKNLGPSLIELGMRVTTEQYVRDCTGKAQIAAVAAIVISAIAVLVAGIGYIYLILAPVLGVIAYMMSYNMLLMYPVNKTKSIGADVEKDVLFAARDMIVSMRSGVPLFNAMATVSVGYGAASREFEKIIDRVQLGMPMDQAIDEVSAKSGSPTFKKLMLQASTSIKVGSDVITSIQEVINDVSQERVIELRRYGQRLNAIAMFYMLFGVIFPSMGIAVAAIMSTFISIFTMNNTTLVLAIFGLAFLQFVFLKMVSSSRPSFTS